MIDKSLGKKLHTTYKGNLPFPYIVIDNFLPEYLLKKCKGEILKHDIWHYDTIEWTQEYQQLKFYYPAEFTDMNEFHSKLPITTLVLDYLNSDEFLQFLRDLTGHQQLYRDPVLMGGGIHRIKRGGKLAVHLDYNEHPETKKLRKLNVLIYLNENWKSEWGGNLELWSKDLSTKEVEIEPIFNRMVIFDIEKAPHGHPIPLNSPENIDRYSLALYYFTDNFVEPSKKNQVIFYGEEWLGKKPENKVENNNIDLENLFK